MKIGQFIEPNSSKYKVFMLEEFSVASQRWLPAIEVKMSLEDKPFDHGGFRDVFKAFAYNKLYGEYVVKMFQEDKVNVLTERAFTEEEHARKTVQMHSLARHLAMKFALSVPQDFGENFTYTKLFYGKFHDGKKDILNVNLSNM